MRHPYDLGFYSDTCGRIGSLMTNGVIPVIAGDSISVNADHIFRLSPIKRQLLHDAQVDLFAFFVPFRHIYGQDWIDLIHQGMDSGAVSLDTVSPGLGGTSYTGQSLPNASGAVAKWIYGGYNHIWNWFFRFVKLTSVEVPLDYNGVGYPTGHNSGNSPIDGSQPVKDHGFPCARLKRPWTTGIVTDIVSGDHEVSAATVLDLIDLAKQKQIFKTQLQRDYFAYHYKDVIKELFGGAVSTDAAGDERPTLIMRKKFSLAGRDIDGSDDAALGTSVSKSLSRFNFNFRRRFIPEHGAVYLQTLVRFPTIMAEELIPQLKGSQNYLRLSGDPALASVQEPLITNTDEWFTNSGTTSLGTIPFGQMWRTQPNFVHENYKTALGFQFLTEAEVDTHREAVYHDPNDYDNMFSSTQLGHWQAQSTIQVEAMRNYPTAVSSIMAGTK